MSEKKLSLFELHFHDGVQFGPRTLEGLTGADKAANDQSAGLPSEDEPPAPDEEPVEEAESGSALVRRLVGLGVLAAAAYAMRKLLTGESSGLDALDDIEAGIDDVASEPTENDESISIAVTSDEESGSGSSRGSGRTGLAITVVIALLVVLALAARKLLGDAVEEIEIPEELAEG